MYVIRFCKLQAYALHVPFEALPRLGKTPEVLNEMECQEVLHKALPNAYHNELITNDWQIMTKPWHSMMDKLQTLEPMICSKMCLEKQICKLTGNDGGDDNDGRGQNGEGKHRKNRRQRGKDNGNGNGNSNGNQKEKNNKGSANSPFL